jgi:hypothetical protein
MSAARQRIIFIPDKLGSARLNLPRRNRARRIRHQ